MSLAVVVVLPAPPHPAARNTAARYYAALLQGMSELTVPTRVLAIDDGGGADARSWAASVDGIALSTYESEQPRRDLGARLRRLRRPLFDAAPAALRAALDRELLAGYDVLHVETFHLGRLAASAPRSVLSVLHSEARDARSAPGVTLSELRRRQSAIRGERMLLRAQRHLRAISPDLLADIRRITPTTPVAVIPLSLDPGAYDYCVSGRPPVVGLIGSMRWPPTRAATIRLLREVWPIVAAKRPGTELLVAGWAADSLAPLVKDLPGVTLVTDIRDHREFFARIGVLAFPLEVGSGMKIKVLESMASGVPVVTTAAGLEGLRSPAERAWWEAADAAGFAADLIAALDDPRERERRAHRARRLLEEDCAPSVVARQLLGLYQRVRDEP